MQPRAPAISNATAETALSPRTADPTMPDSAAKLRVLWYLFFPGSGIGQYTHGVLNHFQQFDDFETELVCLPTYECLHTARYRTWPGLREFGHRNPIRRKLRFLTAQAVNPARFWRRVDQQKADLV